ncbi:MAG: alpha-glucosidase C-terminal domain-containing protein [Anaerolineae bacterium]|nr:alpha-glucosidase C-terminal domain-containing protein [Anaerolineae bacterium]
MRTLNRWLALVILLTLLPLTLLTKPSRAAEANVYHNSRDTLYRSPIGAVPTSTDVTLRLRTAAGSIDSAIVRTYDLNGERQSLYPMTKATTTPDNYDYWEAVVPTPSIPTLFYYRFIVRKGDQITFYEDDVRSESGSFSWARKGGPGVLLTDSRDQSWQITVYRPDFTTPQWMHDAVVYQIFPDRFRNGDKSNDPKDESEMFYGNMPLRFHQTWNAMMEDFRSSPNALPNRDFFGGDLKGIEEKLPYLKELGVTALYLNPIFQARSNHRYDTVDYKAVDPFLGTQADWDSLVRAANQQGIRIILDGVFNHVSSDGPYFDRYHRFNGVGACENVNSPYRDWFFFRKPTAQDAAPNACIDDGKGDTAYESWAGFDSIPKLNSAKPAVRDYIYRAPDSVARTWIRSGASGWRLDVAGDIDSGGDTNMYWEEFRKAVRETNPDAVIIGEIWDDVSRWVTGTQFDSTMNYRLRAAILSYVIRQQYNDNDVNWQPIGPSDLDGMLWSMLEDYPPQAMSAMMNVLGSHDVSRLLYVLGNDKQSMRLAAFLQFVLPGAPTIYYGDEIALNAPSINGQDDPYNRAPYPWSDESGNKYGPPDQEMYAYYKQLAQIRAAHPALRDGAFRTLLVDDQMGVYAFLRHTSGDAVVVATNRSDQQQSFTVDVQGYLPEGVSLQDLISGETMLVTNGTFTHTIKGRRGAIYAVVQVGDFLNAASGDGKVELRWPVRNALVRYNVYRSFFPNGGFTRINGTPIADNPPYVDTTVENGTRYYYYLETLDSKGLIEGQSNVVVAGPGAPIRSAQIEGSDTVTAPLSIAGVSISAKVTIDSANKQRVTAQAALTTPRADSATIDWQPMNAAPNTTDNYTVTLKPRQAGDYTAVTRFSTDGGLHWTYTDARKVTITPPLSTTPPASPANVRVTQASLFNVTLTWDAVPGAYAYRVYKGKGKDAVQVAEITDTTFRDVDALEGQTHTYTVTAIDQSLNESQPTKELAVKVERQLVKVTFRVTVPSDTPANSPVYLAGDFGVKDYPLWNPGGMKMTDEGDGKWSITLNLPEGSTPQYKYVRGTWDAVEKGPACEEIANRTFAVKYSQDGTLIREDTVAKWRDVSKCG